MGGSGCTLALALLVVLVVVLVAAAGRAAARRFDAELCGLWGGDPAFLAQAKLGDLQLFLAPGEGGERRGYLVMSDLAGDYLANGPVTLRDGRRPLAAVRAAFRGGDPPARSVALEGGAPLPSEARLTLSPAAGTLALHDDDKVYAFLVKDPVGSAAALAAWEAPAP